MAAVPAFFCCGEDDFASGRQCDGLFDWPPSSNERHQLALRIGVAVDVPLCGLDRPVASKQLDIAQRSPGLWTRRAALVTNVRRPEWDEQPLRPIFLNALLNHTTMLSGVIGPPRSDAITWSVGGATSRHSASAAARSGCKGIDRPLHFLAATSGSSIRPLIRPAASVTMVQVKFAISPARSPALADNSTSTRFLSGFGCNWRTRASRGGRREREPSLGVQPYQLTKLATAKLSEKAKQ